MDNYEQQKVLPQWINRYDHPGGCTMPTCERLNAVSFVHFLCYQIILSYSTVGFSLSFCLCKCAYAVLCWISDLCPLQFLRLPNLYFVNLSLCGSTTLHQSKLMKERVEAVVCMFAIINKELDYLSTIYLETLLQRLHCIL